MNHKVDGANFDGNVNKISDWKAPALNTEIDFDIDDTPLQLRTWADNDGSQLWLKFLANGSAKKFTMSFVFNKYSVWLHPNCHSGYEEKDSYMKNVPSSHYKTWTIFKSATALKIECNSVEVWRVIFSSISQACHDTFTMDSSKLVFNEKDTGSPPSPTIFFRPAGLIRF